MVTACLVFLAACLLLMGIAMVAMVISAFRKSIITKEIILRSLPEEFDGFRILFITDIHRRRLPEQYLNTLKDEVDVVFLGGDMTEKGSSISRLADNMKLAASIAPAYAVHGNHDYQAEIKLVDRVIKGSGVKLLMDENLTICRKETAILLTGVDFPKQGGKRAYAPLPAVTGTEASLFRIILVHDPLWLSVQSEIPADLILAGHTHGGQVVLPFIGHRHVEDFYRDYSAGVYEVPKGDGSGSTARLLISRGYGTSHLPLRWGSPAEMHVLTLRRSASSPEAE